MSLPPDAEILERAIVWRTAGHGVQLVTVAATWGSSPRPPGSIAVVRDDGAIAGSVSGGCIERQLAETRQQSAAADVPTDQGEMRSRRSSVATGATRSVSVEAVKVADEQARRVGLTCGGRLELVFEDVFDVAPLERIVDALAARRRVVRELDVDSRRSSVREARTDETFSWDGHTLVRPFGPDWRLLLIGAGELSRQVARIAGTLDFEVMVCEPRAPFREAFDIGGVPLLDELPDDAVAAHAGDARSAVLALTHEPSLDDLALEQALGADCFHIGALGSRRSHARRCERLTSQGVATAALARISAPVGLDIGSRSAAEIAVSIVAELIQVRARLNERARASSYPADELSS